MPLTLPGSAQGFDIPPRSISRGRYSKKNDVIDFKRLFPSMLVRDNSINLRTTGEKEYEDT